MGSPMSHDDTKPLPTPAESRTDPDSKVPVHPSDSPTAPGIGMEVMPNVDPVDVKKTVPARRGAAPAEAITKEEPLAARTQERFMPNEAPTAPGKVPAMIREVEEGRRIATTVRDLPVKMVVGPATTTEPLPGPKVDRSAVTTPDRPLLKKQDAESGPFRNPLVSTDEVQIDELLSGMGGDDPRGKSRAKPAVDLRPDGSKADFHAAAAPPIARVEKPSDGNVLVAQSDPPAAPASSEPMVAQAKPADDRTTVPPVLPRADAGAMRKPLATMPMKVGRSRPWWVLGVVFLAVLAIGGGVIWLVDMQDSVPPPVIETNPTTAPTATPRVAEPRGPTPDQPMIAPSVQGAPAGAGSTAPAPASTKGGARTHGKGATSVAAPNASGPAGAATPSATSGAAKPANPDKDLFQPSPN